MDVERVYKLHEVLIGRRVPVSKVQILVKMECSESTFKRTMEFMKNNLRAPIEYLREENGYLYTDVGYELPGFWLSTDELLALVSLEKLLSGLNIGLLNEHLSPFKNRIDKLLKDQQINQVNLQRIRLLPINARINNSEHFQMVATAILKRLKIKIIYHSRGSNQTSERIVSPQRLAHYKDNWYLDVWCHLKNNLRTFAVDKILKVSLLGEPCKEISEAQLDNHFKEGYGIFSGEAKHVATLRFTPERARWIADEMWHPEQQSEWMSDGTYQLHIPYSDERELIMDIMRHLPHVQVVEPFTLRKLLNQYLQSAIQSHSNSE